MGIELFDRPTNGGKNVLSQVFGISVLQSFRKGNANHERTINLCEFVPSFLRTGIAKFAD